MFGKFPLRAGVRLALAAIAAAAAAAHQQPAPGQEPLVYRIVGLSEAEQIAFANATLNDGMQVNGEALAMLILNRSSLVLPMMEKKIEEVLRSQSPLDLFTSKTVDPQGSVNLAAALIPGAGDEQALKEIGKLIAIDEKRFGMLVRNTLSAALNLRNPITVAYHGFEIGDPAVDKRIAAWVESQFDIDSWGGQRDIRRWWVDAMLEKYGGVPNEANWSEDPIASRIRPELAASLHDEILRLAAEAFEKRSKK